MAESLLPEIVPGMVAVKFTGKDADGEKHGSVKNVFPVDARALINSGDYELLDNGAVEASRLNANPLRSAQTNPDLVVAEVTGIAGMVHIAETPEKAEALRNADSDDKSVPVAGKAPGAPVNARTEAEKK